MVQIGRRVGVIECLSCSEELTFIFYNVDTSKNGFLGASIEANFIVGSQVRLHRVTHACPQAYFGMILARISGGIRILNRIRLWDVVAHGKRGGGSCSLAWPW